MATQRAQVPTKPGSDLLDFTLRLYKGVLDGDKNVFLSPFSIQAALCLASLGAKGDTEVEVRRALGLERLSSTEVHQRYKEIQDALNAQSKGSTTLETANKMFSRLNLNISAEYKADAVKFYGSGLELLDFLGDAEGSRQTINKWVEGQTRDKIKDLLPFGIIQADTLMVLVNAIYFKGMWDKPFEKIATSDDPFHLSKSKSTKVKMMHAEQKVRFTKDAVLGCSAVELPYQNGSVSMVFIRPDEIDGLAKLEQDLTADKLNLLLTSVGEAYKQDVILGIPKFKMEATYALVPVLAALGITSMFDAFKADFSRMLPSDQAFVSAVIHKAFVEVNEEGTEAAAATAMIMEMCCLDPDPTPEFILDRPFMFAIRDKQNILFMGRYRTPE